MEEQGNNSSSTCIRFWSLHLSLLYTICFSTFKITVGQICSGERTEAARCRNLTTDPVLVLTVRLEYWHAGSPTGENFTLNIPAVGLQGPPIPGINHLQKARQTCGRLIWKPCGAAGKKQGHVHLQTPPHSARWIQPVFRVQGRPGSHRL